jgi:hypothetical protein
MSCCSAVFCGFVVHGSVYGVLGYCRLFGLRVISFFLRKNVAVAFGCHVAFGGGATATPRGLKSFKGLVFLKKEDAGLCSRLATCAF